MTDPELVQNPGFLDKVKDFAISAADRLPDMSTRTIATGAAAVVAFFASSEIGSSNQVEARTPVDDGSGRMALVGETTVKETITKPNGEKSVKISRTVDDPYPNDNYVPDGAYTAINGSIKPSTTTDKNKFTPLAVKYTLPDAYGCGIPAPSSIQFKYNANRTYRIPGRPTHKEHFGKKKFIVRANVRILSSPGDEQKARELRQIANQNGEPDPLNKIQNLKRLIVKPNRSATRKYNINVDKCYPLSEVTVPEAEKYRQLGYEFVPHGITIEYKAKIRGMRKGFLYESEQSGYFSLEEIRAYNPEAYKTAP